MFRQPSIFFATISLLLLSACASIRAESAASIEAEFRGCESAGWCRFAIDAATPEIRVRPDGIIAPPCDDASAIAVRDRLNLLLSSMIHQHKRIELGDLRELGDGSYAAAVTVNGLPLVDDPVLMKLREAHCADTTARQAAEFQIDCGEQAKKNPSRRLPPEWVCSMRPTLS